MKTLSLSFLLLSCINFCAWGMKPSTPHPAVIFCGIEEFRNITPAQDVMVDEMRRILNTSNAVGIFTNNIVRHLTKKRGLHAFDFQGQASIFKHPHVNINDQSICSQALKPTPLPLKIKKSHIQKSGVIVQVLQTLFPGKLDDHVKKIVFLSGHGDNTDKTCGTTFENTEKTLLSLKDVAKLVVIQSCHFSTTEILSRIQLLKLPYTVISTCIGDTVSKFRYTTCTPKNYYHVFSKLNQLKHPINKNDAPVLVETLNTLLDFATDSTNICQVLYPSEQNFKILACPQQEHPYYCILPQRIVITGSQVLDPVKLTGSTRLTLGTPHEHYKIKRIDTDATCQKALELQISPARKRKRVEIEVDEVHFTTTGTAIKKLRFTVVDDK